MSLLTRLESSKPLILDGALGTLLPEESQTHSLWSTHAVIKFPGAIRSIHESYIQSGAELVQTSTYQTSEPGLKKSEFDISYRDALVKSIDLAYEAKGDRKDVWVVGSVGPYGSSLSNGCEYTGYYGDITEDELREFHRERIEIFCEDPRIDMVGLETMPNIIELKVLMEMMQKYNKMYYLCLSVNGNTLADKTDVAELSSVIITTDKNLIALGVNCLSLENSINWMKILSAQAPNKNLIVYPNSGELYDGIKKEWIKNPNGTMSWRQYVTELKQVGNVKVIGGCCRTSPADIKEIKEIVDEIW